MRPMGRRRRRAASVGNEHHPTASHRPPPQRRGVQVALTPPYAEVERTGRESDDLSPCHSIAPVHGQARQAGVGGSQAVGVHDGDDQTSGDGTGERHPARSDRRHRRAHGGVVLDAPVPGEPRLRRWTERVADGRVGRRPVHGPSGGCGRRGGGTRVQERGVQDDDAGHEREPASAPNAIGASKA